MEKEVPQAVKDEATRLGFNYVRFCGKIGSKEYYSIAMMDKNNLFVPIGLPMFLCVCKTDISFISGEQGLHITAKLQK